MRKPRKNRGEGGHCLDFFCFIKYVNLKRTILHWATLITEFLNSHFSLYLLFFHFWLVSCVLVLPVRQPTNKHKWRAMCGESSWQAVLEFSCPYHLFPRGLKAYKQGYKCHESEGEDQYSYSFTSPEDLFEFGPFLSDQNLNFRYLVLSHFFMVCKWL